MLDEFALQAKGKATALDLEAPLPTGRHALPPEVVAEVQRARLLEAMLWVVGEIGYAPTTVQDVLERAGTSRRVFFTHFRSKEECFLAAYEAATRQIENRVVAAASQAQGWRERLRAGLSALLAFLDTEPEIGRALIVEVHGAGSATLSHRIKAMKRCAAALDQARSSATGPASSALTPEGIIGGAEHALRARLRSPGDEKATSCSSLLPELMHFAVLSYLGPAAAEDELEQAAELPKFETRSA